MRWFGEPISNFSLERLIRMQQKGQKQDYLINFAFRKKARGKYQNINKLGINKKQQFNE